jgi:hypothetical protein
MRKLSYYQNKYILGLQITVYELRLGVEIMTVQSSRPTHFVKKMKFSPISDDI